ncbi:MAG: PfkB family carbohydrate kinase [Erysipelotrichaceae bacterium]|jgi:pseudouridine kinase|nr:PfkB family carbohydrate kinase [Erysipelotrichaceae bacterium]
MTDREREIFTLIQKNPMISHEEIAGMLGISRSTVAVHIASIMRQGYIAGKGYVISEKYAVVLGVAIMDVFGFYGGPILSHSKNPDGNVKIASGGAARNIAENLARLGFGVKFLSVVGDDTFGHQLLNDCQKAGMDISGVKVINDLPTATYLCLVDQNGDQVADLTAAQIQAQQTIEFYEERAHLIANAQAIVMTAEAVPGVVRWLHDTFPHIPIYSDVASLTAADSYRSNLPYYHFLKMNLYEAAAITGIDPDLAIAPERFAQNILDRGVKEVLITLGESGAYYQSGSYKLFKAALPLHKVINSSGAGDAFTAGFLYGVLNQQSPEKALDYALAASWLTCQHPASIDPGITISRIQEVLQDSRNSHD